MNFRKVDYSGAIRSELAAIQSAGGSGGGAMHLGVAWESGRAKVVVVPIQQFVEDGKVVVAWGPAPQDIRAQLYHDPVKDGAMYIEGQEWARWVTEEGYVVGAGTKPIAYFGPDGIATTSGYTPGGVWYNAGDRSEHPSAAPGIPAAGGAKLSTLLAEALALAKRRGL